MNAGNILLLGQPHTAPVIHERRGLVRADGIEWVDGAGAFYPLGGTLMWALRGVRYEPARIKDNQRYLALHGANFQRVLGHVDWPGNDIDYRWSMTEDVLGYFLDYSWGEFGLRTSMSLLGCRISDADAIEMCIRFADVVSRRPQTILDVDCANEATANRIDLSTLKRMALTLREHNLPHILSLTDAEHSGLSWDDVRQGALQVMGANGMTSHPDRDGREDGCRFMRQPYDCRDLRFPIHLEEPIGPGSSVNESYDPLQLAMLRANGLCHGEGAFVLHNGAGVFGVPNRNRPANLWETKNIDAIMAAVKNVELVMPPNVGRGRHWNNQVENPFRVQTIWPEDQHGANRRYCVEHEDGFVCPTFGVVAPAVYVCRRACHIEVFDPVRGSVVEHKDVAAGGTVTLTPTTLDEFGHGAFIVRGVFTDDPSQRAADPKPEPFGNP